MQDELNLPNELIDLSNVIAKYPESFTSGSNDIRAAALTATKFVFDIALKSEAHSRPHIIELLSSLTPDAAPQTRSQSRAQTQNGKPVPPPRNALVIEDTPLPSLYVDGMDDDQIWEQLDLRAKKLCETLEEALEGTTRDEEEENANEDAALEGKELRKALMSGEDGLEALEGMDWDAEGFEDEDSEDTDSEDNDDEIDDDNDDVEMGEDITQDLRDPSEDEDEEHEEDGPMMLDLPGSKHKPKHKKRGGGHSELDDNFFDLASFNAETDEAEAKSVSKGGLGGDDDDGSSDEESVDLFAPVDEEALENLEAEAAAEDDGGAEPFYKDFFDPPPRAPTSSKSKGKGKAKGPPTPNNTKSSPPKAGKVRFHEEVRVRNIKPKGKNLPLSTMYDDDDEDDEDGEDEYGEEMSFDKFDGEGLGEEGEEELAFLDADGDDMDEDEEGSDSEGDGESDDGQDTIARLKDDLFAEEDEPQDDLTAHEKRIADLQKQIQELESENVAKKDWVLMGEATSKVRPHNSLLEEDLEFERLTKAVPVITEEVVQGLEERIKARILEGRWDDVVRLRPADEKPFLPSRFLELQDSKSSQSLAQIYEGEYTAAQEGGLVGDDRDGKLKKEHDELEKLWDGICGKLDALCNAHYTPKQPKATISTVSNVAATSLESALPTSKSASAMLAPEEVFAPSASDLRARSELTPDEKRALRTKERKARKKSRDALDKGVDKFSKVKGIGGVKRQKEAALKSVVKTGKGVTVVGKKAKDFTGRKDRTRH